MELINIYRNDGGTLSDTDINLRVTGERIRFLVVRGAREPPMNESMATDTRETVAANLGVATTTHDLAILFGKASGIEEG
jgi:hypothetical protein